jgi:hypothetical protein
MGGKVRREEGTEGDGGDSESAALSRLHSLEFGALTAVGRFRLVTKDWIPEPGRFVVGEHSA